MADRPAFWSRPAVRPSLRTCVVAGGVAGGAAAGGAVVLRHHRCPSYSSDGASTVGDAAPHLPRLKLSAAAIEAIAGAMGEVAQISLLYPLDTIKVRCQAQGVPAGAVLASLSCLGPRAAAQQLFAGAGQAAVASVLVGAVHFMSFCSSKRLVGRHLDPHKGAAAGGAQAAAGGAAGDGGGGGGGGRAAGAQEGVAARQQEREPQQGQQQQQQQGQQRRAPREHHLVVSHGASGSHFTPVSEVTDGDGDGDAGGGGSRGGSGGGHGGGHSSGAANLAAAMLAAIATAVVEAPLELFRHNAQAGTGALGGNFFGAMLAVVRQAGSPLPLYRGLTAYSLEAIPYDVSELAVVGNLNDGRAAAEAAAASGGGGPGGPLSALALAAPQPVWDVGVGAVAGAAAVIASMPFDVVKTYMQVNPSCGDGLAGFAATARHLVAKGGPGALWLGLAPRLAHQVPGACICWWAIHATHRHLMEHHHEGPAPPQQQQAQAQPPQPQPRQECQAASAAAAAAT